MLQSLAHHFQSLRRQLAWTVLTLVGAVLVIVALSLAMPTIERQLHRWQLLPEPQQLTELFMEDVSGTPHTYAPGQPLSLAFDVHNRTDHFKSYSYIIWQTDASGERADQLAIGSIEVAPGDTVATLKNITPIDLGKRTNIRVVLTGENLSINYWLEQQ